MYEVYLKDLQTNNSFVKKIGSPFLLEQFLKKIRYSKKIKYLGYKQISIY